MTRQELSVYRPPPPQFPSHWVSLFQGICASRVLTPFQKPILQHGKSRGAASRSVGFTYNSRIYSHVLRVTGVRCDRGALNTLHCRRAALRISQHAVRIAFPPAYPCAVAKTSRRLEFFLPHRHQCGLELHAGRLRESLHRPPSEQRHPVLMNAIYLWACYLSRPGPLAAHEQLYLSRALAAMNDAIPNPSKVIDLIQASCLLSLYFLSSGRLIEGSYYASSAAALAIQWGLHQIGSSEIMPSGAVTSEWDSSFRLEPAKDAIEQGERILTFWQVYDLDRCWSVALQRPAMLPDSKHPKTTITTPWPQRMEEYETVSFARVSSCGQYASDTSFVRGRLIWVMDRRLSAPFSCIRHRLPLRSEGSPRRHYASKRRLSSKARANCLPAGTRVRYLLICASK